MAKEQSDKRVPVKLGKQVPRVFTPPLRELTEETTLGFAMIRFARDVLRFDLFPWQEWFLIHAFELLESGKFRFRTILLLVARQNGKSTLSQVISLFFLYVEQVPLVIGTAQNLDISEEVWSGVVEIAEATDELAEEIKRISRTNGKKALELIDGNRYRVQPASRKGGRGMSGDLILLDELREHQSWDAWSAVTKTTMARPFAVTLCMSNAGDASSVVLRHLRKIAHKQIGDPDGINRDAITTADLLSLDTETKKATAEATANIGLFEWSAAPECDIWDREQWTYANPSMGHVDMVDAIASAAATDPEWEFRTEVLCQWNDGATESVFPSGSWGRGISKESRMVNPLEAVYCVEIPPDRQAAYIAAAGLTGSGDVHVELVAQRAGTDWIVDWFRSRASAEREMRVVARRRGAAVVSVAEDLEQLDHVEIIDWGGANLGAGCGRFFDAVIAHNWEPGENQIEADRPVRLWHPPQPALDIIANTVVTRPLAGGDSWLWSSTGSPYGCASIMAATGAVWDVLRPKENNESAYDDPELRDLSFVF